MRLSARLWLLCDIPLFTARADAIWLEANSGKRIESCLSASPYDQLLARIRKLGDDDRLFQERLIGSAIAPPSIKRNQPAPASIAALDFTAMAVRLGRMLDDAAIRSGDHVAWFGVAPIDHEHVQVAVLGLDLYGGTIGMAIFLAALARITGDAKFRDLALAAAAPAREGLSSDSRAHVARSLGIGGAVGVGSIIYGLVCMAGLLDEPSLLTDARSMAGLLDAELIAADRSLDVVKGAAGAILGLLALHHVNGDDVALANAAACGRHLLQTRVTDRHGNLGWATVPGRARHLTGFSHGAAGIALALLRLHRATGDSDFRAAAEDALAYERGLFIPHLSSWPDFRFGRLADSAERACHWCHGAAGIGLARVSCLDLIDDDQMAEEIEAALSSTLAAPQLSVDYLCCGNFGRIDFLLTAGLRLARPELVERLRARARQSARGAGREARRIRLGQRRRSNESEPFQGHFRHRLPVVAVDGAGDTAFHFALELNTDQPSRKRVNLPD